MFAQFQHAHIPLLKALDFLGANLAEKRSLFNISYISNISNREIKVLREGLGGGAFAH